MLRWPAALLFVALLLAPTAAAFSTTQRDISIAYDLSATPVVVAAGDLGAAGVVTGGFFVGGSTATRLEQVPTIQLLDRDGETVSRQIFRGATLEVSGGGALWSFDAGELSIGVDAPYAVGLALPQAPIPSGDDAPPAGFLLAGEGLAGAAQWSGEPIELVPLDAIITIRDARGQPYPEWDGVRVNRGEQGVGERADGAGLDIVLRLEGAFRGRLAAAILAGATSDATDLSLTVARAEEDRFAQTVALIEATTEELGGQGETLAGQQRPLALLSRMSGLLNGALLVVGGDGTTPAAAPLSATWGGDAFAVGAFNLVRGDDLSVEWSDGKMRLAGEPTVALGREGFAVDPPARVGLFPLVSLVLWALAIGAIVWWVVQRPPKVKAQMRYRLLSILAYALVLLLTLYLWDRSFAQTFGTSALTLAREQGVSAATLPQIGVLAGIELVPWGVAALLFALPVRIAAGVALQRLGKGKSFKGVASAAGLVSLAIFGPIYALWCFNIVWARAGSMMGG